MSPCNQHQWHLFYTEWSRWTTALRPQPHSRRTFARQVEPCPRVAAKPPLSFFGRSVTRSWAWRHRLSTVDLTKRVCFGCFFTMNVNDFYGAIQKQTCWQGCLTRFHSGQSNSCWEPKFESYPVVSAEAVSVGGTSFSYQMCSLPGTIQTASNSGEATTSRVFQALPHWIWMVASVQTVLKTCQTHFFCCWRLNLLHFFHDFGWLCSWIFLDLAGP